MNGEVYFEVESVLGKRIRTTREHWKLISEMKHPIIKGHEKEVKETVSDPDEIRRSKKISQYISITESGPSTLCAY